jgi:hypothetical protein
MKSAVIRMSTEKLTDTASITSSSAFGKRQDQHDQKAQNPQAHGDVAPRQPLGELAEVETALGGGVGVSHGSGPFWQVWHEARFCVRQGSDCPDSRPLKRASRVVRAR